MTERRKKAGKPERKSGHGDSVDNFERTKIMVAAAYEVWCRKREIKNHSWAEQIHANCTPARKSNL